MALDTTCAPSCDSALASPGMQLRTLPDSYAVVRLEPGSELPEWVDQGPFRSVTRTEHEVSVVCRDHDVPEGESVDRGWTVLEMIGPLDFTLTGVISSLVDYRETWDSGRLPCGFTASWWPAAARAPATRRARP